MVGVKYKMGDMSQCDKSAFDCAVLLGRFQPPHAGHVGAMRAGLAEAGRLLVLSCGARQPRSTRAPFRFAEVREMILGALAEEERARVRVEPLLDRYEEAAWGEAVARAVGEAGRVVLAGAEGEEAERVRRLFPGWAAAGGEADLGPERDDRRRNRRRSESCDQTKSESGVGERERSHPALGVKTRAIREDYLAGAEAGLARWAGALPESVAGFLRGFAGGAEYAELKEEARYIAEYRAQWAGAPYPPIFVTVDAVVIVEGHVLLVERGHRPGRGLWALPGGFVEAGERIAAAMRRELAEETGLALGEGDVGGRVKACRVFDAPCRSARGRMITHAFLVVLEEAAGLAEVKGGDDAARAFWKPLGEVVPERMFEDHWQIIEAMAGGSDRLRARR